MKRIRPYLITVLTGLLAAAAILAGKGIGTMTDPLDIYGAFCDALFVPGILVTGFGLLIEVAGTGFFDIFSYGFRSLLVLFTPLKKAEKHRKYYEFKLEREARRTERTPHFILITGLGFVIAAGICLAFYASAGGL